MTRRRQTCKRAKRTVHQRVCGMNKCKKSRNILGAPSSEYGVEEKLYRIARSEFVLHKSREVADAHIATYW